MNDTMYISLYSMYLYVYAVCLSTFPPLSVRVCVMLCVHVWVGVVYVWRSDLVSLIHPCSLGENASRPVCLSACLSLCAVCLPWCLD